MSLFTWSSRKTDVALGGTRITVEFIKELANIIPAHCVSPIVGAALKMIDMIEGARMNKQECTDLQDDLKGLMVVVLTPLRGKSDAEVQANSSLKRNLDRLAWTLTDACTKVQELEKDVQSKLMGLLLHARNAEKLRVCRESLKWAIQEFQVEATIQASLDDARRHLQSSHERAVILQAVVEVQEMVLSSAQPHSIPLLPTLQLPAAPETFKGRDKLVAQVVSLLTTQQHARVFLCGSAGIGKTSLALTVAHHPDVVKRFGNNRHWIPCEGVPTPAALVETVARGMEIRIPSCSGDPFKDLLGVLQTEKQSPRFLILDNFETPWNTGHQARVREILCTLVALKCISTIMTTRDADPTAFGLIWSQPQDGTRLGPLGPLQLEAAREAYLQLHPHSNEDEKLDSLLLALDCYPLAITLMAGQGALGETPSSLLHRWEEEKSRLLSEGPDKQSNLEISISFSINSPPMTNNPQALQVLGMLALLPAGTTIDMLPQLPDLRRHLSIIIKVSLACHRTEPSGSVISILSPISAHVLQNHPPDQETLELLYLVYDHLIGCYWAEGEGSVQRKNAMDVLSRVQPNIDSVFRYSLVHGDQRRTFNSIVRYTGYSHSVCPQVDLLRYGLDRLTDGLVTPSEHARALYELGESHRRLSSYPEAREALEQADASFKSIGDQLGAAQCQWSLGETFTAESRNTEARQEFQAAQSSFRTIGNRLGIGRCQQSIGGLLLLEDHYAEAREQLEAAQMAFKSIGDKLFAAQCQQSLGEILHMECRYPESKEKIIAAELIFDAIGDQLGVASCRQRLAVILRMEDNYPEAMEKLQAAKSSFKTLGNRLGVAQCTQCLGDIMLSERRSDEARLLLEDSESSFKAIGHQLGAAQCRQSLGEVLCIERRYPEARDTFRTAELMFEAIANKVGIAQCQRYLGEMFCAESRFLEGKEKLQVAESAFKAIGNRLGVAQCQRSLGKILLIERRYVEAEGFLQAASSALQALGRKQTAAYCLYELGTAVQGVGRASEARDYIELALAICREFEDVQGVERCERRLEEWA